jgi:SAM-dependent methyltransferase
VRARVVAVQAPNETGAACCSRVLGEVNRRIDRLLSRIAGTEGASGAFLDVGCWDGASTLRRGEALAASRLLGIEVFDQAASAATQRGIEVARLDLETERFPWPDGSVDVVVCNQVLEHLKNIWLPLSEMHRVLRRGGRAILSVPNLGSLHNRLLLAFGRQPTSIRVFGPHVRGYTLQEFTGLVERGGGYRIERKLGAGFYPVPSPWSAPLSALWRGGSHTLIVQARKEASAPLLDAYLREPGIASQTFYGTAELARSE